MGLIVIATYRPKPGKEAQLAACVAEHLPVLRRQGLVTERPSIAMRSADGTVLEVFEWKDRAAVDRAHADPVVQALWGRFDACCTFAPLGQLPESGTLFPEFSPL